MQRKSCNVKFAMSANVLEFSTYCIGNLAEVLHINQTDVYQRLASSGILKDYVMDAYDVTHTYSKASIMQDLSDLMKQRGVL